MATTFDEFYRQAKAKYAGLPDAYIASEYERLSGSKGVLTDPALRDSELADPGFLTETKRTLLSQAYAPMAQGLGAIAGGFDRLFGGVPGEGTFDELGQRLFEHGTRVQEANRPSASMAGRGTWSPYKLGQNVIGGLGQIVPAVVTGGAALAPLVAADAGRLATELEEEGVDPEEARLRASAYGVGSAALERVGLGRLIPKRLPGRLIAGAQEAGTEIAQGVARSAAGGDPLLSDLERTLAEEGLPAGIAAALLGKSARNRVPSQQGRQELQQALQEEVGLGQLPSTLPRPVASAPLPGTLEAPADLERISQLPTLEQIRRIPPEDQGLALGDERVPYGPIQEPAPPTERGQAPEVDTDPTVELPTLEEEISVRQPVFHGSPYQFSKFDSAKIGTGEGAQAYGHGLYFSEVPGIAKGYAKTLASRNDTPDRYDDMTGFLNASETHELASLGQEMRNVGNLPPERMARWRELHDRQQAIDAEIERRRPKGSLYHVDIPDEQIGKMLDWDAPLSQQPESVKKAITDGLAKHQDPWLRGYAKTWAEYPNATGEDIYKQIVQRIADNDNAGAVPTWARGERAKPEASAVLRSLGIPGIKYLDAGSRQGGKGTRNFVVFDDSILKIIDRDGEKVEQRVRPYNAQGEMVIQPVRSTKDGRLYGAPTGKATEAETDALATKVVDMALQNPENFDKAASWYEKAGNMIRNLARGDPKLMEDMTRIVAYMSADSSLGTNVAAAVQAAYHQATGGEFTRGMGRYPVSGRTDARHLNAMLQAQKFDAAIPGVSDKVMSFYRNLRDPTFERNDFPEESTLDKWMHRIFGYPAQTETLQPAQYAYGREVLKRAAAQANQRLGRTDILPRHIQAAAWVNVRGKEVAEFSDYLNRRTAFIPWETKGPMTEGFSPEQQERFHREATAQIVDAKGTNRILAEVGLAPLQQSVQGEGTWGGAVTPNTMTMMVLPGGAVKDLDLEPGRLAALYLAYARGQDAALYYVPSQDAKVAESKPGLELLVDAGQLGLDEVREAVGNIPLSAFTLPDGRRAFHFLNMEDQSPTEQRKWLESLRMKLNAIDKPGRRLSVTLFRAKGSLQFGGEDGANYLQGLGEAGRPDLQDGARRLRSEYQALVQRYREEGGGLPAPGEAARAGPGLRPQTQVAEPTRAYAQNPGQQSFNFETRPDTNREQVATGNAFMGSLITRRDRLAGASVLADGLTRDFAEQGFTPLVGQTAKSPGDFAALAQVYRDPRVETLRLFATKAGRIVGQTGLSQRLPGSVSFGNQTWTDWHGFLEGHGADGFYLLHNHPNGSAEPSPQDLSMTRRAIRQLHGMGIQFKGHVIVDHNEYGLIRRDGTKRVVKRDFGGYDPNKNPRVPHGGLGYVITKLEHLGHVARELVRSKPGEVTIITTGSQAQVKSITSFPRELLITGPSQKGNLAFWQAAARIRRLRAASGSAGYVFAVTDNTEGLKDSFVNGLFTDVIDIRNTASSVGQQWAAEMTPSQQANALAAQENLRYGLKQTRVTQAAEPTVPYQRDTTGGFGGNVPPTPPTQAAAPLPSHIEAGGGRYTTAPLSGVSPEASRIVLDVMQAEDANIEHQRRGTLSIEQLGLGAEEMLQGEFGKLFNSLANRIPGTAANAEKLIALARIVNAGAKNVVEKTEAYNRTNSAQDLAQLEGAREQLGVTLAPFMGYRTEAGRALRVLREVQADFQDAQQIFELLGDGKASALQDFARKVKNARNVDEVLEITRASYQPTLMDQIREYWINGLLSGPWTHAVNLTSTWMYNALESGTELATSLVSRNVSTKAALQRFAGMLSGVQLGIANAGRAFSTEQPQLSQQAQIDVQKYRSIPGKAGRAIRIPGRALMAEDEFNKAVVYSGELHRLALEESQKTGASFGDVLRSYANNREKQAEAKKYAERLTFQTPLGSLGRAAMSLRDRVPVLGWLLFPFVRTPTNIVKRFAEYTPAGFAMPSVLADLKAGGRAGALAKGRMLVGTAAMAGVAQLVLQGLMTGAGPEDDKERELWMRTGRKPYSVKVNGQWVRYNRFEPLGMLLGVSADLTEMGKTVARKDEKFAKVATLALASFMTNLGDKTFLRGITDFTQAVTDPARYMEQWAQGMAGTAIPNVLAQTARAQDPYMRDARTTLDSLRGRIPGLRGDLPAKLDVAGQPIERSVVEPLAATEQIEDPLAETMLRLGANKGSPSRTLTIRGRSYEMSPEEYEGYKAFVQQARWNVLTPIVSSPEFKQSEQLSSLATKDRLERLYDKIGSDARNVWLIQHPEVIKKIASQSPTQYSGSQYIE